METYQWIAPPENALTGQTKIKEADNKIQATIDNLVEWSNGTGAWASGGLQQSMESRVDSYLSDTSVVEW